MELQPNECLDHDADMCCFLMHERDRIAHLMTRRVIDLLKTRGPYTSVSALFRDAIHDLAEALVNGEFDAAGLTTGDATSEADHRPED